MVITPEQHAEKKPLTLRFLGALVEQLGAQLYPSATATVAELISNAWDADASRVWVSIPLGEAWAEADVIEVLDDGHGMTRDEAQQRYLMVGRKRRLADNGKTPRRRLVHGRKGIGKLAAFGTAELLECETISKGEAVAFRLDYNQIRKKDPGEDCEVEEYVSDGSLRDPNGNVLQSGTKVRLSRLKVKRAIPEERFIRSMSRRFATDQTEMQVLINGVPLQRFNMDLEFRYPQDKTPGADVTVDAEGWGNEVIEDSANVRWWIGFTHKPLEAEYLRGISILARGKMVQRPFLFERARGATGQLGQEYIVGEVEADWLDVGNDIEDDIIQANRDQLQLEDERIQAFIEWGKRRVDWALAQRQIARKMKSINAVKEMVEDPKIRDMLGGFTETEQGILMEIAAKAASVGDPDPEQIREFMHEIVTGYKDKAVRKLMERVKVEDEDFQGKFWGLVREFSLIDARKNYSIIKARLETIDRLDIAIKAGAREVPDIHNIIKEFPWLLDPRWSLMGDEVPLMSLGLEYTPNIDEETGDRLDYLFALQPEPPAPLDQVLVVEIKRGYKSNGAVHRVNDAEITKFQLYVLQIQRHYARNSTPPAVRGVMIANDYTERADLLKQSVEHGQEFGLNS